MPETASELARRLGRDAEAVCRHYLPAGRREGRYWLVGDVDNSPGRSLYVRLHGPESGKGAAGKWTDAATGEHGDLLDLIAANRKLDSFRDLLDEARAFLRMPRPEPLLRQRQEPAPQGSPEAARRLWAMSKPVQGTTAEAYLRLRGITDLRDCGSLRFHPRCWYRGGPDDPAGGHDAWPALIAAVRDGSDKLTGVGRTWLDPSGMGKAPVSWPRRAMGNLLGNGVRFGVLGDMMAAGEGTETMLSLRQVAPNLPAVAALSAAHLAALILPSTCKRLYIVEDADPAGRNAVDQLAARAKAAGVEALRLRPTLGDLNEDLARLGTDLLTSALRTQFAPEDVSRFLLIDGATPERVRAA